MKRKEMQISVNEIVEIAFGTLLNQPSISFLIKSVMKSMKSNKEIYS